MDLLVFIAVLVAAACHAGWNALLKLRLEPGLATALASRWDKPADAPDDVDEVDVEIEELDEVPE